jgi:hypothetical protein
MSIDERVLRLENAYTTLVETLAEIKSQTTILIELARDSNEKTDTHLSWINQLGTAQAESERKISALVDAQIKTEDTVRDGFARLTEAQTHTDQRLDALIDIVRGQNNGN